MFIYITVISLPLTDTDFTQHHYQRLTEVSFIMIPLSIPHARVIYFMENVVLPVSTVPWIHWSQQMLYYPEFSSWKKSNRRASWQCSKSTSLNNLYTRLVYYLSWCRIFLKSIDILWFCHSGRINGPGNKTLKEKLPSSLENWSFHNLSLCEWSVIRGLEWRPWWRTIFQTEGIANTNSTCVISRVSHTEY